MSLNGQNYCESPIYKDRAKPEISAESKMVAPVVEPKRISRDRMFMDIASVVAMRGTCNRARVGAVLVDKNYNIVSIGYNGAPSGEPHCDEAGHVMYKGHCIRTIHAEENCINKLPKLPESHYTLYVTHKPCAKCQVMLYEKLIANPGTSMLVVYGNNYGETTAFSILPDIQKVLQFNHFKG